MSQNFKRAVHVAAMAIALCGAGVAQAATIPLVNGSFELSGRRVDLKAITAPTLNVFALDDHIIPPTCSRAPTRSSPST